MQRIQSLVDIVLLWPLAFVVLEHSHFCKVAVQEPMFFHKPAKLLVLVCASHHILIQIERLLHCIHWNRLIWLRAYPMLPDFNAATSAVDNDVSLSLVSQHIESLAFIPRITKNTTVRRVLPWGKWRIKNAVLRAHTERGTGAVQVVPNCLLPCRSQPLTKPSLCLHITMPATPTFVSRSSDKRNQIDCIVFSLRSA